MSYYLITLHENKVKKVEWVLFWSEPVESLTKLVIDFVKDESMMFNEWDVKVSELNSTQAQEATNAVNEFYRKTRDSQMLTNRVITMAYYAGRRKQ